MLDAISRGVENPSTIVIAEAFRRSGMRERFNNVDHSFQHRIEVDGNVPPIALGQHAGVHEKIQRVHVIMQRLFEVNTIASNLPLGLAQDELPTTLVPNLVP